MIGKRAKKPFPAKFGAFCNTPHRLLEIILNPVNNPPPLPPRVQLLPMILFYDRISKRFEAARARNQWLPVGRLFPVDFPLAALNKVFPRTSLSPVRERKLTIDTVCPRPIFY